MKDRYVVVSALMVVLSICGPERCRASGKTVFTVTPQTALIDAPVRIRTKRNLRMQSSRSKRGLRLMERRTAAGHRIGRTRREQ